jgi:hypothetical protein
MKVFTKSCYGGLMAASLLMATAANAQGSKLPYYGDESDKVPDAPVQADSKKSVKTGAAFFRVLHTIPGGPNVDVYVDGKKTLSNIGFKTFSDYLQIANGEHTIAVHETGKTEPLVKETKLFGGQTYATIGIVYNAGKLALYAQNESSGGMTKGKARIRLYQLAPATPLVEFTLPSKVVNAKTNATEVRYARLFDKPFGYKSGQSRLISPGIYTLQVRHDVTGDVLKEITGITFEDGKRYSVFLLGKANGTDNQALDIVVGPVFNK